MASTRRDILKAGLGTGALFLPQPWAWVWAQSDGALRLLKAPKLALVIGNGRYKDAPVLKNAPNDATAIAEALKALRFNVTLVLDAGRKEMQAAMRDYGQTVEASKGVGLFYFAGHGLQLAWRNYLLPVDAAIDKPEDVKGQGVDVDGLVKRLDKAANPMNVIILDACRENPFAKDFRARAKGLSQMDAPRHTLLAYATSPGNVASDGEGANGLYTENLLREMKVPEAKIEDVFKRVRLGVRLKSNGAQIPWESTSLEEDFWFQPPASLQKPGEEGRERAFQEELALWEKARGAKDPAPFEAYLRRYPSGSFSELAQARLDRALARRGEKKVGIASAEGNPYTQGSAVADMNPRLGDTYTYRATDMRTGVEKEVYSSTVEKITDDEVYYSGGLVTDRLGNALRQRDGRSYSANQFLPLEFAVGKRWSTRYTVTWPNGRKGEAEMEARVLSRERVTVPAGTFNAFKIEWDNRRLNADGRTLTHAWFAPDKVRRPLRREEVRTQNGKELSAERVELVSYKQA
jgi:uncharacterized caspase-like protein